VSPTFKVDGMEQSPEQAAEAFNNYFLNITEILNIHSTKDNNLISLLKKYYPSEFPPMQAVPITDGEIRSIISSLKSKNPSGYDGISTKILKLCGNQITKPLAFIFNKSLTMYVFPERLKYAVVIPLYKKGAVSSMANYRQISLLPVFSKVFQKSMYYRLNQHLQANSILATEQYGFRKGLSTEHATFSLTENILMAWNKKIHIGGIFCDLTKAFDCVIPDVLIAKRKHFGIQESTLNWFNP